MNSIVLYICIAFVLNLVSTTIFVHHYVMPPFLRNNNVFYNLHSCVRVILFSWYILSFKLPRFSLLLKIILPAYLIFAIINFVFFESLFIFSSRVFSIESIILLILCILYFISSMQDESGTNWLKHPSFIVCTGISLYESVNFFIFLFFYPLFENNPEFGKMTMTIANMMYVILCLLLALALRKNFKLQEHNSNTKPT